MVHKLVQTRYPHVFLRGKTYYFRIVIPPRIRALCPSLPREIKRSLRTDSLSDAIAMVGDKFRLIKLLMNCNTAQQALSICHKLSNFGREVAAWVDSKFASNTSVPTQPLKSRPAKRGGMKLDRAWSDFVAWKRWTDKQAKDYDRMYQNLRLFLGNVSITSITKRSLREALSGISGLPQRNKKDYGKMPLEKLRGLVIPDEDKVSSKYVKEHLKLCQGLFNRYLKQEREVIELSPTEGLKWEYDNNRYGCLSDSEIRGLVGKLTQKPEWFKWFFMMAIYTGARRGEIAGLTKDDFKFCSDTQRFYFVIKEGKTKAARRSVPIHDELIRLGLLKWVDSGSHTLFETANRDPNRVTGLFNSIINTKLSDHGERLVFHSLRHTFITKARAAGVTNVLVQQVVGHEKRGAGQTDRYTHTFQLKDVLKVVDVVEYGV